MAKKNKDTEEQTSEQKLQKLLKENVYHRVVALLENKDLKQYGIEEFDSEQEKTLYNSISSLQERREANVYVNIYNAILQYGKLLIGYKDLYRAEAEKLTGLINVYETQLQVAERLSNGIKSGAMRVEYSEGEDKEKPFILHFERVDIALYADGRADVMIDGEGGLYEEMQKQAEVAKEALTNLKTYLEPLSDFIYSSKKPNIWPLCPRRVEQLLDYPDYIPEQSEEGKEKYFKSNLNKKKEEGEEITPDMEKWALYPDYNELEEPEITKGVANSTFNKFLEQWNVERK